MPRPRGLAPWALRAAISAAVVAWILLASPQIGVINQFIQGWFGLEQPPFDGPELKYRFGRHIGARTDCDVFGYRL